MSDPTATAGTGTGTGTSAYRVAFWSAVAITVAAWLVPYGRWAIYPFSLLATWAHEMGHGLAALATGGRFVQLEVFANLSGLAQTAYRGSLSAAVVSAGGLLGAPFLGSLIIAAGPRPRLARVVLGALAAGLLLSVVLWVRNGFGAAAVLGLGAALGLCAWKLPHKGRFILVQLLGIQLSLSALKGWRYLFTAYADMGGGRRLPSDVAGIADALFGPHWLWGGLIMVVNLGMLYGAYRLALRALLRDDSDDGDAARA